MSAPLECNAAARRQAAILAGVGLLATLLALPADAWLVSAFAPARTEAGRHVMVVLTNLGAGWLNLGIAVAIVAVGWSIGRLSLRETGLRAAVAVAAAGIAVQVVKHLTCRARPEFPGAGTFFHGVPCWGAVWGLFSFPSGHATTASALAVALGLRVPALRLPAAVGVAVVMVSRVYLGAHFPSDVVAGATLGAIAGVLAAAPSGPPAAS